MEFDRFKLFFNYVKISRIIITHINIPALHRMCLYVYIIKMSPVPRNCHMYMPYPLHTVSVCQTKTGPRLKHYYDSN